MYIPDLFGAYVKGRELAIEKNWQDLKNFENVENLRNQNDLTAMDIWERRQQMPGKMSMFYDNVNSSSRANQVADAGHRGMMARANMGSDVAVGQYGVYKAYEPQYIQTLGDMLGARIGQQANAVQNLLGQNEYLAPIARELGQITARTGANQVRANGVLGDNFVNAAEQQVTISNGNADNAIAGNRLQGIQLGHAIANQDKIQENTVDALGRVIPARNAAQAQIDAANSGTLSDSEIGSLISLAKQGDEGAAWRLEKAGYNIDGSLKSTQTPQGAGGQTATPATSQTQNGVPVGTNTVLAPTATPQKTQPTQGVRLMFPIGPNAGGTTVRNYPVSPTQGVYRPLMPTSGQTLPSVVPPNSDPNSVMNLTNSVGLTYMPAYRFVQ